MWLSAFAPAVADWQSSHACYDLFFSKSCICKSPAGTATDESLTVYADDLAKVLLLQNPGQYKSATASQARDCVASSASALQESLGPASIAQNEQHNQIGPTFIGEGSFHARRVFLNSTLSTGGAVGRHLGSMHSYCNSNNAEMLTRIKAMWAAFHHMRDLWKSCNNYSMSKNDFQFQHHRLFT